MDSIFSLLNSNAFPARMLKAWSLANNELSNLCLSTLSGPSTLNDLSVSHMVRLTRRELTLVLSHCLQILIGMSGLYGRPCQAGYKRQREGKRQRKQGEERENRERSKLASHNFAHLCWHCTLKYNVCVVDIQYITGYKCLLCTFSRNTSYVHVQPLLFSLQSWFIDL